MTWNVRSRPVTEVRAIAVGVSVMASETVAAPVNRYGLDGVGYGEMVHRREGHGSSDHRSYGAVADMGIGQQGDKPFTLVTARLLLQPLSADGADALHRISNEPDVRRYLWDDEPVAEGTVRDLISQSARMFSEKGVGLWGVRMRGNEELLGFCGFVQLEGMEEMELSYGLTREVWGRGLATEASRACLRYAFEEAGLERAIAGADASNGASLRIIEKLGMRHLGSINSKAPAELYYALSRETFIAKG